jgi:hypothetical protein
LCCVAHEQSLRHEQITIEVPQHMVDLGILKHNR